MTKEVLVTIKGLQYSIESTEEDDQRIETLNRAVYAYRNGHDYLSFEECFDENISVKNLIKFDERFLEVNKRGAYSVHMLFEEGKKNYTNYNTPFGSLTVGIDTHKITVERGEDEISVCVSYGMEINYAFIADSEIEIHIQSI